MLFSVYYFSFECQHLHLEEKVEAEKFWAQLKNAACQIKHLPIHLRCKLEVISF